ncbi:hypothetical protein HDV06_001674 [Boothiomyces sp. JEL0866]|nr:hypothetical protein HDV06_001674 [Boothiomyces sp. JEL0866]
MQNLKNLTDLCTELSLVAFNLSFTECQHLRFAFKNNLEIPRYKKTRFQSEICSFFNCSLENGPCDEYKQFFYSFKEFTDYLYKFGIVNGIYKISEMIRIRPLFRYKRFDLMQVHSDRFYEYISRNVFKCFKERKRFLCDCVKDGNEFLVDCYLNSATERDLIYWALPVAVEYNQLGIMKKFMQDKQCSLSSEALHEAAKRGNVEAMETLLQDERLRSELVIQTACRYGQIEILQLLLKDPHIKVQDGALTESCTMGHLETTKLLLQYLDPSCQNNFAIIRASQNGHFKIVELLLNDKRVDPSAENNMAIRQCARRGYLDIIKLLSNDKYLFRVEKLSNAEGFKKISTFATPNEMDLILASSIKNKKLQIAEWVMNSYSESEKRLSKKQCDLRILENSLLTAVKRGYFDIVKFMIENPSVDPKRDNAKSITIAAKFGHTRILQLLVEHGVNSYVNLDRPLREAAANGHLESLELLLELSNTDPNTNIENQTALSLATSCNQLETVAYLLAHPKVDPTVCNSQSFVEALKLLNTEMLNLYFKDGRFKLNYLSNAEFHQVIRHLPSDFAYIVSKQLQQ